MSNDPTKKDEFLPSIADIPSAKEDASTSGSDNLSPQTLSTIADLIADYEREGELKQNRVERLLLKRKLPPDQCIVIVETLRDRGIQIAHDSQPESEAQKKRRSDLLTAQEEVELGRAIALGVKTQNAVSTGTIQQTEEVGRIIARGEEARARFTKANLRLVTSIAKRYVERSGMELEDLQHEGIFGLMKAVEKYDYNLGFRFSTYATWWITQTVTRAIDDKSRLIRIPVHRIDAMRKLRRARRKWDRENKQQEASLEDLADQLGWSLEKVKIVQDISEMAFLPIEKSVTEGNKPLVSHFHASTPPPTPEEAFSDLQTRKIIEEALATLPPKQQRIMELRFGLGDCKRDHTLEEIGEIFGVTRERIRQIEAKIIEKLRRRGEPLKLLDLLESEK
jgi:RNA polymerase primary sigma factor